jgi:hypothetical protein
MAWLDPTKHDAEAHGNHTQDEEDFDQIPTRDGREGQDAWVRAVTASGRTTFYTGNNASLRNAQRSAWNTNRSVRPRAKARAMARKARAAWDSTTFLRCMMRDLRSKRSSGTATCTRSPRAISSSTVIRGSRATPLPAATNFLIASMDGSYFFGVASIRASNSVTFFGSNMGELLMAAISFDLKSGGIVPATLKCPSFDSLSRYPCEIRKASFGSTIVSFSKNGRAPAL